MPMSDAFSLMSSTKNINRNIIQKMVNNNNNDEGEMVTKTTGNNNKNNNNNNNSSSYENSDSSSKGIVSTLTGLVNFVMGVNTNSNQFENDGM